MNKVYEIVTQKIIDKLKKLPDLFYAEDLDTMNVGDLVVIMEALDDASDYINDYLTDNHYIQNHTYPEFPPKLPQ